jgi:DNA-binding MarR family transcriptional regulator
MKTDAVDDILEQWSEERPELETESLGVVVRIMSLTFGLPATGLAKETGLSSGAMTNRIDKLEERGLVSRNPDASDRRAVIVALTPDGKRAIDEAIQLRLDAADESLQGLSSKEIGNLASLLRKIRLTGTEATEDI